MTRLNLKGEEPRTDPGFWRRQFMPPTSGAQRAFDVLFGVVAPVLCFFFDPIVFKSDFNQGLFSSYQAYAYMVSGVEILLLLTWLIWGKQLRPRTGLVGGILMAGALFSGVIGVLILPFSLLGLALGIGILRIHSVFHGAGLLPQWTTRPSISAGQLSRSLVGSDGRVG